MVTPTKKPLRYTLQDWLTLHNLTKHQVRKICHTHVQYPEPSKLGQHSAEALTSVADLLSGKEAWELVNYALCHKFPEQALTINHVKETTHLHLKKSTIKNQRTYTYKDPVTQTITVACPYQPTPKFLVYIAHEFAHALHYAIVKSHSPTPIQRETCAFIGELCLLEYLVIKNSPLHRKALAIWQRQNTKYLGRHLAALLEALENNPSYQYFWNYPIARINAIHEYQNSKPKELWRLFFR